MLLYQPSSGYCYNSDSIFLYDFISSFSPRGALLDVGCGAGIISLLLSRDFPIKTSVIDKQEKMLVYARHNYFVNSINVNAYLGDFVMLSLDEKFDFIVSNPPFYDSKVTQSENVHLNIARYAHHLPIDTFVAKAKRQLKPRGWFIFCYDAKQIDLLLHHLKINGINPEKIRFIHSKIDRESKLVMIAARMNSKAMTQVMPPLVVFDAEGNYTLEAAGVFERADTHSIKGDFEEKQLV
ncbi:MAG TPA: methyltransferase [Sulfurovum sp. UBA12169]|nr:MAG TPA: methyltransferase [Sulfurovum sp. UBA12169]